MTIPRVQYRISLVFVCQTFSFLRINGSLNILRVNQVKTYRNELTLFTWDVEIAVPFESEKQSGAL